MQLYNGKYIENFFNFNVKEFFDVESLAHSCSLQARFTGHSKFPIWVSQHMRLSSELALLAGESTDIVLGCHIHDLSEGFSGDLNRCIKHLPGLEIYKIRENFIEHEIFRIHGLKITDSFLSIIKYYDNVTLSTEAHWAMDTNLPCWQEHLSKFPSRKYILLQEEDWREAKKQWLERYYFLTQ